MSSAAMQARDEVRLFLTRKTKCFLWFEDLGVVYLFLRVLHKNLQKSGDKNWRYVGKEE